MQLIKLIRNTGAIGVTITLLAVTTSASADLSNVSTGGNWGLCPDHQQVAVLYVFGGVPFKPYVQEFKTPGGINVIRDAPSDHLHHHGLMFAIRANGINFWEEKPDSGKQERISGTDFPDGGEGFIEKLRWEGPEKGSIQFDESRTLKAYPVDGVTLLSWQSALHGLDGKPAPNYHGTNYNGLGMRFLESMDKGGTFFNADGGTGVAGTAIVKSKWCAYTASADGKPVTVAMFDHPTNERHPATWYTMDTPFAYLSATLALDKEPLQKIDLTLTYGVAAWDGTKTKEEVEEMYQRWLKLVEPLVASTAPAK